MSANLMYLVCRSHPERVNSLVLGKRNAGCYGKVPDPRQVEKWFEQHAFCGGGRDHFTIAYDQTADWDVPKPAPVADAVHAVARAANEEAV